MSQSEPAGAWDVIGVVADSIAALGAVGALVLGLFLLSRQLDDSRRAQAEDISLIVDRAEDGRAVGTVHVANYSKRPIYAVRVMHFPLLSPAPQDEGTGPHILGHIPLYARSSIRPGETTSEDVELQGPIDGVLDIIFRDSGGRFWHRFDDGRIIGPFKTFVVLDKSVADQINSIVRDQCRYGYYEVDYFERPQWRVVFLARIIAASVSSRGVRVTLTAWRNGEFRG